MKRAERLRNWGVLHFATSVQVAFFELRVLVIHAIGKWQARRYRGQRGLKLNLGCGPNIKAGWVNIDLAPNVDLHLDLRKRLPFADGSCALTYSEHFFEHLDYPDDAILFLQDNFRVLEPGGTISFGVPDAGGLIEAYASRRARGKCEIEPFPGHPEWVKTWMDQVNFCFRQNYTYLIHQHRYAYDLETLERMLKEVGFTGVQTRQFDPLLDDKTRRDGTLYVTGLKPGAPASPAAVFDRYSHV